MKFLPPAAALQLTQKSSKAVESAAAVAEVRYPQADATDWQGKPYSACVVQAAADAVVSAQDLVQSCKEALKKAEHACSSLIGIPLVTIGLQTSASRCFVEPALAGACRSESIN